MSLTYRKLTRDTIMAALAANFNAKISELAGVYGVPAFAVDFSSSSRNFAQTYIDESNIETSNLIDFYPVAGCLYTDEAMDTGEPRNVAFTGNLTACIDWFVRPRDGIESQDTESLIDMLEDATLSVLLGISPHTVVGQTGIWRARKTTASRERQMPLGDGYFSKVKVRDVFAATVATL